VPHSLVHGIEAWGLTVALASTAAAVLGELAAASARRAAARVSPPGGRAKAHAE
jgi:hypothetical protein